MRKVAGRLFCRKSRELVGRENLSNEQIDQFGHFLTQSHGELDRTLDGADRSPHSLTVAENVFCQ